MFTQLFVFIIARLAEPSSLAGVAGFLLHIGPALATGNPLAVAGCVVSALATLLPDTTVGHLAKALQPALERQSQAQPLTARPAPQTAASVEQAAPAQAAAPQSFDPAKWG